MMRNKITYLMFSPDLTETNEFYRRNILKFRNVVHTPSLRQKLSQANFVDSFNFFFAGRFDWA